MEIAFAVVTPPRYNSEVYIDASVENRLRVSACPTRVSFRYHVGGMSYTDARPHDEGSDQFFHVDAHHYGESCL